jgi:predicted RNase H-like nuclease
MPTDMPARVIGADAYSQGWVGVALVAGRVDQVWPAPDLATLLAGVPAHTVVGVDMPVGGVAGDWRDADRAAKRLLGAGHSAVFSIPPREVWTASTFQAANTLCRRLTGVGLSVQAYGLLAKILDADGYRGHRLYEIHPEVAFARLNGGAPLPERKKTWNGQMARRALLAAAGIVLPELLDRAGTVPPNDVLDAAAVAWSAARIAAGTAQCLPDPPTQWDRGDPVVIWS